MKIIENIGVEKFGHVKIFKKISEIFGCTWEIEPNERKEWICSICYKRSKR